MLPYTVHGSGPLSLIFMPFLGGSQLEWGETIAVLEKESRCITADLPGFGDATAIAGYTVDEMADAVTELLAHLMLERYILVGHSMAGKVSAVVARRLLDDPSTMKPPTALILVAPSPPGPEPMSDSKRSEMLEMFRSGMGDDLASAEKYIRSNITCPVSKEIFNRTAQDVLRINRSAWTAWLESGSKEDWAERVGLVDLPALIVAADDDSSLGPSIQEKHTLPHFPRGHQVIVACNHLTPIEQPVETAALISNFLKVLS